MSIYDNFKFELEKDDVSDGFLKLTWGTEQSETAIAFPESKLEELKSSIENYANKK